jgi:two-component system response regulator FixJ
MTVKPRVFIVDDDASVRDALKVFIEWAGYMVECYDSAEAFLDDYTPEQSGCLLLDNLMPEMSGLELQKVLRERNISLPVIFLTAHGKVPTSVKALKSGAIDFLEKPFDDKILLKRIREAIELDLKAREQENRRAPIVAQYVQLTPREQEVMKLIVSGHPNKTVGQILGVSSRTVEVHRAHIMKKMGATSLSELIAMAVKCGLFDSAE